METITKIYASCYGYFYIDLIILQPTIHIGIYHCMLYNQTKNKYYLVKWGVNMRGPYFEDLLEKYELNIIYGKIILIDYYRFINGLPQFSGVAFE